ncbi:MAG: putative DNA modification/repair radical SAM protein [Paenibacillus macerans]|uniref:4Fe-4S single cluster domain protein n=1 Tax=Paenibacillus macerans TaxID=44252 RepID=A0A090ZC63_PAEMA|nr:putative DNA modification/repair radical SAM protein [Paenibacillus macerans]KFN07988.1 4Fe-4S single cluster domain protein [Paenibacillus macerans]MBS5909773.1 putative DNA modification/repair radical SAM protein [Paenibacillus macerans]MCY7556770.1 putative DNA modification/repair radical SAM protein [Paenibacillus macerans]MDU7474694.1 putative DNA modification/repair radical SAM protein [Paenibacillus macerans]MEC0136538.1 putative DNA modification/repair radical SAM protein [Paenibaci
MDVYDKLTILTDSAKYDVSCSSSGAERGNGGGSGGSSLGNAVSSGICHSFATDGRCISLLKVLMTNSCIYDCKYCVNRRSNDTRRAMFTPEELAELTINFYRRNYIEGLFLSSGIMRNPDYTTEQLIRVLELLRRKYHFGGYIHVKAIPGADPALISRLGLLADRMSVNIELPSQDSLHQLAPDKSKEAILRPMTAIRQGIRENSTDLVKYRHAPRFVPGGQSTQMIVGATPDSDLRILTLTEALYRKYELKRVYYSAYTPVAEHSLLPSPGSKPPLLREHRLYQADWLLRFYGFEAKELLDEHTPNFNLFMDPKCHWALNHIERFPVEINKAPYEELLRVPGIGVRSAKRIVAARRTARLDFSGLKKLGVVLKRAQYFIICSGRRLEGLKVNESTILRSLLSRKEIDMFLPKPKVEQLSLFSDEELAGQTGKELSPWLLG